LGFIIKIDVDKVCEKAIGGEQGFNTIINDLEQNCGQFCSYNLILMDCNMPFMDGYQCSEMIRAYLFNKGVDQPIIVAMTGHTEHKYIERALNSGMNMVMFKPCNQFDLKRVINDIGFEIIKPVENRLESLLPVDTEIIEFQFPTNGN